MVTSSETIFELEEKCYKWFVLGQRQDASQQPTKEEMAKISYESIGKDRENNIDGFDPTLAPFALSHPKAFKAHAERNLGYWSGLAEDILNHKHSYFVHIYPCLRVIETGIQLGSRETWHMAKYLLFLSTSLDEERDEVVH
eukprot:12408852-Ditylum_brightwellii.AAC.1